MITIYKYPLEHKNVQSIILPKDSEILSIQIQNDSYQMWVKIDTEKPEVEKLIYLYGTGFSIPSTLRLEHITSILDGDFVWHFFDLKEIL